VADIDAAISDGPGLRWALMGPHLSFHLAGGGGGIAHFFDQFAGPMEARRQSLGQPRLSPELREAIGIGIAAERLLAARLTNWRRSAVAGWPKSWF
jgi:carnitine 3-dehydrogenase